MNHFIFNADCLVEYVANFKEVPINILSLNSLQARKIELKELWSEVKNSYSNCVRDKNEPLSQEDLIAVKSKYKFSTETYIACLELIMSFSDKFSSPTNEVKRSEIKETSPSQVSNQELTSSLEVKDFGHRAFSLPPCDCELFHGDYLSWPSFRDMFSAVYLNHTRLSPVQKLFHLRSKTRGDAFNIVSKFALTDSNFDLAWKALSSQYENKRILVNCHLKILFNLPTLSVETDKSLKQLHRNVNDCLCALTAHGIDTDSWDSFLTFFVSNRLPEKTLSLWEQSLEKPSEIPTWSDMSNFIVSRYKTLETISDIRLSTKPKQSVTHAQGNKKVNINHAKAYTCVLCPQNHSLRICPSFTQMSVQDRSQTVQAHRLCSNCLASNHTTQTCKSQFTCKFCKKRHHTLLHSQVSLNSLLNMSGSSHVQSDETSQPLIQSTVPQSMHKVNTHFSTSSKQILLATALISIYHRGSKHILRAVIDPGSEVTLIAKAAQIRLGLPVTRVNVQISGVNKALATTSKGLCHFCLGSNLSPIKISAQALIVDNPTGQLPSQSIGPLDLTKLSGFKLADPQFHKTSRVDILIGADLYADIILEGVQHNIFGKLLAQNTIFGWIISGSLPTNQSSTFTTFVSYFNQVSLDDEIKHFWELEEVIEAKPLSHEDQFCEKLYSESTYRTADGKYVVQLPFIKQFPQNISLGNSRRISEKRLIYLERRLKRDPLLESEYYDVIKEYLDVGHMKYVKGEELMESKKVMSYYMPHHAVVKPESSTTKVRVVFNASSHSENGKSLNDVLYTGPVLQQDLMTLVLEWRKYKFVLNADIAKMYRQIRVHPRHTPFQRILFRPFPDKPIQDFELQTVTFGVKCSPYLAIRTLLRLAEDEKDKYPIGASMLRNNFYVDDLLAGFHSIEHALEAQSEIISILDTAGFQLRKWTANNFLLLQNIPRENVLNDQFLNISDQSSVKTLGVFWNAKSDTFHFKINPIPFSNRCTKREVFSHIAKIFDPAGWTAPVLIKAKILLQTIWKDKTQWDENLTSSSLATWKAFTESFSEISKLRVPRWIKTAPHNIMQVHGFCDSSEQAYAAAIYIRVNDSSGTVSSLLCAKTKVAPVVFVTLPRLELCGAVLLSKIMAKILPMFKSQNPSVYLWSDSSIVLAWLAKPPFSWRTFVANRTSKIRSYIGDCEWRHVSSSDNPADLATRGLGTRELINNDLWWHGPTWLSSSEDQWPSSINEAIEDTDLELKPLKSCHAQYNELEDILTRFSSLARALRVISYVLRFLHLSNPRLKFKFFHSTRDISREEIIFTKKRLIVLSQKIYFQSEYEYLKTNQLIKRSSKLLTLNPVLDAHEIMRVNGRLVNSSLSWSERYPIILPYESRFAKLLLEYIHKISLHGGNQLMLTLVRQEYWIPKLKNLIKACVNRCKICVIHKKNLRSQLMAALPPERSNFSRPFSKTGMDFAGPFQIKTYIGRNCRITKGYVCLFVCFSTKAIHLEGTTDLTTAAFLAAFHRFVARRGLPQDVYSDNGTNFIGSDRVLKESFKMHLRETASEISQSYTMGLSWHFIPPGSPHMGGLWEAGVKSFKTHFNKTAGGSKYTFEEFMTLLCRIEACLNSRPISAISENLTHPLPLTPGHFLIGAPLLSLPEPIPHETSISLVNRWEKLKLLHIQFCKRWKEEYLKEMHKRFKWKFPQRDIKIGDIVAIRRENLPPTEWRLGRVVNVFPGSDGMVRVASIKTQQGEIIRPVVKLCVIPSE